MNDNIYNNNKLNYGQMKIAIIGGGPSGLGLARVLQLKGCKDITIYERSTHRYSRIQGSSLDLHKDFGQVLIKSAQLEQEFKSSSRPEGECFTIVDKNGEIVLRKPFLKITSSRPEIDRGTLRDILLDSLQPDTVKWDCHFKSLRQLDNGKVEIKFTNEAQQETIVSDIDLVVGSDGVHSKVRKYVTQDTFKPEYMGITMIEGEVEDAINKCPKIYNLVSSGLLFALQEGIVGLCQQKTNGSIVFSFVQKVPIDWISKMGFKFNSTEPEDINEIKDYLKLKLLPNWSEIFHHLIDNSITPFKPRILYRAPIDQSWKTQSNIVVIGDAAHSISPFAGLGCNISLLDSHELATILTDSNCSLSIKDKLEKFELQMLNRWRNAASQTMKNENTIFLPNAIDIFKKRLGIFYYLNNNYLSSLFNGINFLTDYLKITT